MTCRGWCCLAWSVLVVGPALGDDRAPSGRREFPLKYRLTVNIANEVGYGTQYLQPAEMKAPLKEEPKYLSPRPLTATFNLGAKAEKFRIVLDCSTGRDRGYDVLYVDANRDGRITANERYMGLPRDQGVTFGPIKLLVDCGREKCPQWFLFQLQEHEFNNQVQTYVQVMNAGYYEGVIAFGDQKRRVAFVDADANGLYNDYLKDGFGSGDRMLLDVNNDGRLDGTYNGEESMPLGKWVEVGGRYWQLEVAPDGSSVAVEPLDRPLGTVRSEVKDFTLLLSSSQGVLRVRSQKGTALVPAGLYRLSQCSYKLTDNAGRCWEFLGRARNGAVAIEVPPDSDVPVAFGPTLVPRVTATQAGDELSLNLELRGAGREVYDDVHLANYEKPPVPKVRILGPDERELALLDFHYG
jgi:hypothetical protein